MGLDLLNIATSGVMTSQSQLAVTSNNIANANTDGYHRQVATQVTYESQKLGDNYFGAGSYVSDVKRIYNQYAVRELQIGQSNLSEAQTSQAKLSELDNLYSNIGKVVPQSLTDFYASLNSLSDLPDDLGVRQSTLGTADQLATSINRMQSQLDSSLKQTNDQIAGITDRINEISTELAALNLEIAKGDGNDLQLLDKQDSLIQELSQYTQVNTTNIGRGAKSVMIGGSVMLVSGEIAMQMGTKPGDPNPLTTSLTTTINNSTQTVDGAKMGGELGALFKFRDGDLAKASNELGQLALGVADTFNKAQAQGFDLDGKIGKNIFTDINDPTLSATRVGAHSTNAGTASLSVNIDDAGQLTGSAYELKYTAGAPASYDLIDTQTGNVTALTLNGTQLQGADGFTINIDSGTLANGDRFEISPTSGAAAGLNAVMTDPRGIAAASGATITPAAGNSGNTTVTLTSVDNRSAANFPVDGAELTFVLNTTANTYTVVDASGTTINPPVTVPVTPPPTLPAGNPKTVSAYGMTFEINSTAAATDSFTFDLSFAEGDNTNVAAMAKLSEAKNMDGGSGTLNDVFEQTKQDIGGSTKSAQVRVDSAQTIYSQAYERDQSTSGVNLDEEAANLMRFQQSYQASARIMTTATEIFDTLFNSTR